MTVTELKAEVDRIVAQVRGLPEDTQREAFQDQLAKLPAHERDLALAFVAAVVEFKPKPEHFVVLIHGIRTHANWAEMVGGVLLQHAGARPIPLKYGFFDLLKFLCPIRTRRAPVLRLLRELRDLRTLHRNARISAVAHSFGTFALMEALKEPDIHLHRVIFCGCIVKDTFRRAYFTAQLAPDDMLNDCGTHDILPVLAKAVTWGYGATGTFGFGTVGVRDRYSEFGHSGCFQAEFVEKYWAPFIRDGTIAGTQSELTRKTPPYWISILSILPLRWALVIGSIITPLLLAWLIKRTFFP